MKATMIASPGYTNLKYYYLVHNVQHQRENEDPADTLPSFLQHFLALPGSETEGPEIRWLTSASIRQPRAKSRRTPPWAGCRTNLNFIGR